MNFDTFEKPPCDTKNVSTLTLVAGEMVKKTVVKNKFLQLNDKKFYFPDGIVSLIFYHPLLSRINEFKQRKRPEN